MFNYNFTDKYKEKPVTRFFDYDKKLFYVIHNNKKMYFKKSMDSYEEIKTYYNSVCMEQDLKSPHKYTDLKFNVPEKCCVFDIGAAEGIFAIDIGDIADKIFLFECDKEWIEALKATFEPYMHKVEIIEKFVSDIDTETTVTIDNFVKNIQVNKIGFIKMDIEGSEIKALLGAKKTIRMSKNIKLAVCAYHKHNDEVNIKKFLKKYGFIVNTTKGYILSWTAILKPPYFRRGIIRAVAIKD